MLQAESRKRKMMEPPPPSTSDDSQTPIATNASTSTTGIPMTHTMLVNGIPPPQTKRQRDRLIPINYLDVLPKDVLSHLFIYSKVLGDEEMDSLGKTSRSMLSFIQTRYERSGLMKWYLYRLSDIEAKWTLPWTTPEVQSHYVLTSQKPPNKVNGDKKDAASITFEWVILRHTLDTAESIGLESLPFESFVLNEYQPNRFAIGQITHLSLSKPRGNYLNLPHLKFLPSSSLKQLVLTDVLVNSPQVIQTYVWPSRMESLTLRGFHSYLILTRSMLSRWPSALKKLTLGVGLLRYDNGARCEEMCIPSSVVHLCVEGDVTIEVTSLQLPPNLIELTCTPKESLGGWKLPAALKSIHFGRGFEAPMDKWVIPRGLEELTFPPAWNQPIEGMVFSERLTHLNLGGFNRTLIGVTFPSTLTHLEFGHRFQQTLKGVGLPSGLKTLIYGWDMDPSIFQSDFSFPSSLTRLHLGVHQFEDEQDTDPTKIRTLEFLQRLPPNLKAFQIHVNLLPKNSRLPVTLEELDISGDNLSSSDMTHLNEIVLTLTSLRQLSLKGCFNSLTFTSTLVNTSTVICPKLKRVIFGKNFNEPFNGVKFPDSIELIQFEPKCDFNQPIDGLVLPKSLREIHFGERFSRSLDGLIFPPGLEILALSECSRFDHSLVHSQLPESLKIIQLSSSYNSSLGGFVVPPGLERFEMGRTDQPSLFNHIDSLIELKFPSNIQVIRLPNPLQSSYHEHPSLGSYQEWRLSRLHPYARIQFSHRWMNAKEYAQAHPNQNSDDDDDDDDDNEDDEEEDEYEDNGEDEEDDEEEENS